MADNYEGLEPLEEQKALTPEQKLSVQERATKPVDTYTGPNFMILANTGSLAPAWWSTQRDQYLSRNWQQCPLFAGALFNVGAKLSTIPPIIEPRDPTMKSQRDQAERFSIRLFEGSEFGQGWLEFAMRFYQDRWTQDNGAAAEVLGYGPKSGPIQGMPVGLANLDSQRCTRTGNPQWPIVYTQAGSGKRFKLHYTRVIFGSQMTSTRDEMNGVGLCWFSRVMSIAQGIVDDLVYKQEKLGRRPKRAIMVGKKMSVSMVKSAFEMADEAADNAGLQRVSMIPIVANETAADVGIDLVDLASLPDGFNWETDVNLAMYIIALTGGFPVRWMWPATAVGATKADSLLQHMATAMSGTAHELGTLALLLGGSERGMYHQRGKFLPPSLRIRFDVPDDWIDQVQAEIQNTRAQRYERNLGAGATTVRVTREMMVKTGEVTEAQFREMELEDGRTQDGLPIDVLFYEGTNPHLVGIDPEEFAEEEVNSKLKEAKRASVTEPTAEKRQQAREAIKALEWLLEDDEEEEEEYRPDVAPPKEDAPYRKLPQMTSTGPTEGSSAFSEKERTPIEQGMQNDVQQVFDEFAGEAEEAVAEEEEPDYDKLKKLLAAVLLAWLIRAYLDGAEELEAEYDISFDPADIATAASEWAAPFAQEEAARLVATTQGIIGRAAALYLAGEISRGMIGEMIAPAFSANRAALIAITLITEAISRSFDGYVDLLRRMGLEIKIYWMTAEDERVCGACAPLHNQPEEVWQVEFPDGPPAHGRCRCKRRIEIVRPMGGEG